MQSFLKFLALAFAGAPRLPRPRFTGATIPLTGVSVARCAATAVVAQDITCVVTGAADETVCCAQTAVFTLEALANAGTADPAVSTIRFFFVEFAHLFRTVCAHLFAHLLRTYRTRSGILWLFIWRRWASQGPCPGTMQDTIDAIYTNCDGAVDEDGTTWEESKAEIKTAAELYGCAGAAQAVPALVLAAAAAVNHLLN